MSIVKTENIAVLFLYISLLFPVLPVVQAAVPDEKDSAGAELARYQTEQEYKKREQQLRTEKAHGKGEIEQVERDGKTLPDGAVSNLKDVKLLNPKEKGTS